MFKKSGNTLHITRGDAGVLTLQYEGHTFATPDVVEVNIYRESEMSSAPVMIWSSLAEDTPGHTNPNYCATTFDGDTATMTILGAKTQLDSPITEPVKYWWEATCGDVTFICYDEQGPKILNLYPGGLD